VTGYHPAFASVLRAVSTSVLVPPWMPRPPQQAAPPAHLAPAVPARSAEVEGAPAQPTEPAASWPVVPAS